MIAHLQDGNFKNTQILRPETARLMHSRQFGLIPELNHMCLGFYEESRNGHRIIGHGGDTNYFHSDLHLIADQRLGFFVSYNSAGKGQISPRTALWNHFLDRYFPYQPAVPQHLPDPSRDAHSVTGRYISSRRAETNLLKVANMLDQVVVTEQSEGRIKVEPLKDFSGELKTWQEIGPLLYQTVNGEDLLAFRRDNQGRFQLVPSFPAVVYQRATLVNNGLWNQTLIVCSLLVMALTLLLWPAGALVRAHYRQRLAITPATQQGRLWIRLVCALDIIFCIGLALILSSDSPAVLSEKTDLRIHILQIAGWMGTIGTVLVVLACIRSWRDPNAWSWSKVWNGLVLLACLGFVWFALYWKVLDMNLNY
jgi:hypothetical protein